jgi:hypothetical protein
MTAKPNNFLPYFLFKAGSNGMESIITTMPRTMPPTATFKTGPAKRFPETPPD